MGMILGRLRPQCTGRGRASYGPIAEGKERQQALRAVRETAARFATHGKAEATEDRDHALDGTSATHEKSIRKPRNLSTPELVVAPSGIRTEDRRIEQLVTAGKTAARFRS